MSAEIGNYHLRVARPTNDLGAIRHFYCEGLGFKQLYEFSDHDGFSGIMLGHPGAGYHLEFISKKGHDAGRAPTEDNLLVFYIPERTAWDAAIARLEDRGYNAVRAFNPYWDRIGRTFEDPDGYRIVFQNSSWSNLT